MACGVSTRPWLDLYVPQIGCLLAQQISRQSSRASAEAAEDGAEDGLPLDLELWVHIASLALDFQVVCALGAVCRTLRPISRHPQLWEPLCRAAFSVRGFRPPEEALREHNWSWKRMFQQRKRLRFDGIYVLTTKKLLQGEDEGRGMKETGKDFYNVGGLWVTSYRVLRFYPDGTMFSHLTAQPQEAWRRGASSVLKSRPASLDHFLRGACWGSYSLHERGAGAHLMARVLLFDERYPRMPVRHLGYRFELRARSGAAAPTNCELHLLEHNLYGDDDTGEPETRFAVPHSKLDFQPFHGKLVGLGGHVAAQRAGPPARPRYGMGVHNS